ncbi:FkbM family methyltransferase [Aeromicrobium sp. S22]|uniref:FkbM family methyltransferase n=1 Tax=Aeromicrobium sp. S22 TaxID=2662029 RepID=UPI001E4222E6|nr:FkbM family methyltransferase [Aeromicrobium sp. S22]
MTAQVRNAVTKLFWGVRAVGPSRTLVGLMRLAVLRVRARPEGVVRLRSGPILGFANPSQLVPTLVVFGDYIDPEMAFLRRVSRADWVVVDVGAAIGQFTVFAAKLPVAHVHAFEPSGDNVRTLEANLDRNGITSRVSVHQIAVSDCTGRMLFPTAQNPFLSRLDRSERPGAGATVDVRTLGEVLEDLGLDRVSCLKINVAGFEAEVLAGAEPFLARQSADVLIILISEGSLPWFAKIASHGYRFFFFAPPTGRLHEVWDVDDVLRHERPWPARHLIGASRAAIDRGLLDGVETVPRRG